MAAPSLTSRILKFVLSRPESSISEVLGAVGRYISSSQASASGLWVVRREFTRRYRNASNLDLPAWKLVERGKRQLVRDLLKNMAGRGKVYRLRPGVYGPPKVKIHVPQGEVG